MALLLSEKDLASLYCQPSNMDALLPLIETSMGDFNSNEVAGQARVETSLIDRQKKYRIMTSAVPGAGQGMRISALFRGAKDGYFIVLFDGESGDLLALVAGRGSECLAHRRAGGCRGQISGAQRHRYLGSDRQRPASARPDRRHRPGAARNKKGKSLQLDQGTPRVVRQVDERFSQHRCRSRRLSQERRGKPTDGQPGD